MAIKDNVSRNEVTFAMFKAYSSDNDNGEIIDTADFDMGIFFSFVKSAFSSGVVSISFEEGDDSGLSDATTVPDEKLIGDAIVLDTAVTSLGDTLQSIGMFSTKRYVRAVGDGTTGSGIMTVMATVTKGAEIVPVA